MPITQDWKYDGVSLQTLAFNISTFGSRTRMANSRGGNVKVPYRHGSLWTPKYYDENEMGLAMWVIGADPITGVPDPDPQSEMWANIQTLQRLFSNPEKLHTIEKTHPVANKSVIANCEISDVLDFTTQAGATRAAFAPDLTLPEVWFKDVLYLNDGGPTSRADTAAWNVVVDSDMDTTDIRITFKAATGTPSNMQITNTTIGTDAWVKMLDVMATSEEIIIDVAAWTAELDGATNVVNNVDWSGQPNFFRLLPGTNSLLLNVTGGPVDVTIEWKGRYW